MRQTSVDCIINASSEKIIKAFTDHQMLSAWWGVERSNITLTIGGGYYLAWDISDHGMKYVNSAIIKEYDPESRLHLEAFTYFSPDRPILEGMYMNIDVVTIDDSSSKLSISQGPFPEGKSEHWDWIYEAVNQGWQDALKNLINFLEQS